MTTTSRRRRGRRSGGGTADTPDARIAARRRARDTLTTEGRLGFPDDLPITERRDELVAVIRDHQVVVVAGETGSGKSTQLPKLCLEAGRGVDGMIGHTQPRRVAARSVAQRIADELGSPLGTEVGYSVRFTDQVGDATLVRLMTDGILLAEIQRDPLLRRYDTLIVDEAHERSLNIDFLLGYLTDLLPRRPDLKVIITSATIDTERFAAHFDAPVVTVSGRTHPVEVRYRPFGADAGPDDRRDQVQAVIDACAELAGEVSGDVLVFLSGEREIHDTADALRALDLPDTEILPLYARLAAPEQQRVFTPHRGRRIVLATNVAETSITVPGVRSVVDAGTARISRYSRRLKVQRLPIEPISQASADQRAGRCGRVAPGICIRLYPEDDYAARDEFTEPEILRTNLASVILQMLSIGLGDVAAFPFVEPPDHRSIRDGYALLTELGAIRSGDDVRLTRLGRRLARLPVDPRLGRMLLEADRLDCVREVLVIVAALSIQDVRERPAEHRERAAELHSRFRIPGSDLLSIVALWDHLRREQRARSGNGFRRMCHEEFLHYLRVREWTDLYSQLRRVAGELGIRPATHEAHPDHVHRAVLAGLLSHIGVLDRERRVYRGARQAEFVVGRGSALGRKQPEYLMAAELVETERIFARRVAAIDPRWAEELGGHLVTRSYGEPRWDSRAVRAVTTEQVTLFGVPLVTDRRIGLDRVDPELARAWFVTKALVEGDVDPAWRERQRFLAANDVVLARLASLSARTRGPDLIDDDALFAFYDERIDHDVTNGAGFERWWKRTRRDDPARLDLTETAVEELVGDRTGVRLADFPDVWRDGDLELPLTYRYAPGEPLDGVTVHVPLTALNQVTGEGFDWMIPGRRPELVEALLRTLPKPVRRSLIPFADSVEAVLDRLGPPAGRLIDRLAAVVTEVAGVSVEPSDLDASVLTDDLRLHVVVSDDGGEVHDVGTDLAAIKHRLAGAARSSIAAAAPIEERRGITTWDVGDLPRVVESSDRALDVKAYPTLLDVGDSVALRIVTRPEIQERAMRGGVRRLLLLDGAPSRRSIERLVTGPGRLALAGADLSVGAIVDDCIVAAVEHLIDEHGELPWNAADFASLQDLVRRKGANRAGTALGSAVAIVAEANRVAGRLAALRAPSVQRSVDDANTHLGRLVRPGFVSAAGSDRLADVERYVRAIGHRIDHLAGAAERDRTRLDEVVPLEQRYGALVDRLAPEEVTGEIADLRWQLEELRVAVFAQPIGATGKVSAVRLDRALARVGA